MGKQRFTAQQRWLIGLTAVASFIAVLDGMVVTTALGTRFMAQYFAITQQTSASGAGGRMMPWTVSLFVVAPISGIQTSRLGERLPAVTGLLLQSAALM
jgi:hypothetical protein